MIEQKYTSAKTSINKYKLPSVYRYRIPNGMSVLDYGCGKYIRHLIDYMAGYDIYFYDPFNQTDDVNNDGREMMRYGVDYVFCSNVLNVIDSDEIVDSVIKECVEAARIEAVFTIYEGNKTGVGKATGKDSWQRNEKKSMYIKRMIDNGYNAISKGNFIIVSGQHKKNKKM